MTLERTITAFSEVLPGEKWQSLFRYHWPAYRRWFLSEGADARPLYLSARRALQRHMPELMPTYERLTELAGGGGMHGQVVPVPGKRGFGGPGVLTHPGEQFRALDDQFLEIFLGQELAFDPDRELPVQRLDGAGGRRLYGRQQPR